jgi:histidyl-tRNA synthetase
VVRTLDKWAKLSKDDILERLTSAGLNEAAIKILEKFMASTSLAELLKALPELKENAGLLETTKILGALEDLGYGDWFEFNPTVIRGFDYYDGMVFEVFDKNPENKRAMFGGGRYNGLAEIFGEKNFPAVGFAPGDETTRLFLESWDLLAGAKSEQPEKYYLPLLSGRLDKETNRLAKELRSRGLNILLGLEEQKIGKALEFANKKEITKVIILGEDEVKEGIYKIKDMASGEEKIDKF